MRSPCPKRIALCAIALLTLAACEREQRRFEASAPSAAAPDTITQSQLQPGTPTPAAERRSPYEHNAYAISQGKRLYEWFNCNGCHANGGGAIGPALMDDRWIYGSSPANIYATIVEGRPNGMPAFRGRLSDQQVWQLVSYVRSMSGWVSKDASPGRADSMYSRPSEQQMPEQKPRASAPPPSNPR